MALATESGAESRSGRTQLATVEAILVATIESALPSLAKARELALRLQAMIRGCKGEILAAACVDAGVKLPRTAVTAAIVEPCSNGQTEGHITKLKLVKWQMFGRGRLDLLHARLIATG